MSTVKMQRTFIAIKPDAVQRGFIGEIITRFEKKGFKICALKMVHPNRDLAERHYAEHKDKPFFEDLVSFITEGPIVAIVVEGVNAIEDARRMMGTTKPQEALPGTIRADFAQVKEANVIHGSDSEESAKYEIALYFSEGEICSCREIPGDYYIKKYMKPE